MTETLKWNDCPQEFGGGSISEELYSTICNILPVNSHIFELGSGWGTGKLLDRYRVTSAEHDPNFLIKRGMAHNIVHVPLGVDGWYDHIRLMEAWIEARGDVSLLLIDGPPGGTRRNAIAPHHLSIFDHISCTVIFDDVNRDLDREAMEAFCTIHGYKNRIIYTKSENYKDKAFALCTKTPKTK